MVICHKTRKVANVIDEMTVIGEVAGKTLCWLTISLIPPEQSPALQTSSWKKEPNRSDA
jgi:hypothetical protein